MVFVCTFPNVHKFSSKRLIYSSNSKMVSSVSALVINDYIKDKKREGCMVYKIKRPNGNYSKISIIIFTGNSEQYVGKYVPVTYRQQKI